MRFLQPSALAMALALSWGPALAQQAAPDPAQEERIRYASDLIEMTNLRPMMNQLAAGTAGSIAAAYQQQNKGQITEANRKTIEEVVRTNMAKKLPELIPLLAPATAEAFTTEELKAWVDFYKSPTGQSILDKLPAYSASSNRLVGSWLQQNTGGLERSILAELEQKGLKVARPAAARPAPGQPAGPAPTAAPRAPAAPAAPRAAPAAQPARPAAPAQAPAAGAQRGAPANPAQPAAPR